MVDISLLRTVVLIELVLFAGAVALFFGHGVFLATRRALDKRPLERARSILLAAAEAGSTPADVLAFRRIRSRIQLLAYEELSPKLAGISRLRLAELADQVGLIKKAERECRSVFWRRRLRGARILTFIAGGERVVPRLMRDRVTEIRAQAAEWAAEHPRPEVVEGLLRMLDDPKSLCRYTVQDSLLRLGKITIGPLAAFLRTAEAGLAPALRVARGLADLRLLPGVLRLSHHPDEEVRARSATVLGSIGGHEALQRLDRMLNDAAAQVRASAASALGAQGHWPAAGRVARLIADPAWDVRLSSASALLAMGAPGMLYLRRALAHEDRFAADMARRILELPAEPEQAAL